jgi:hypothetical protein
MVEFNLQGVKYALPLLRWKYHRKVQAEILMLMKGVENFRQLADTLASEDFSTDEALAVLAPMGELIDATIAVFAQSMFQGYEDERKEAVKIGGNPDGAFKPPTADELADMIEIKDWTNLIVTATMYVQAMTPGETVPAGPDAASEAAAGDLGTETPTP